MLKKEYPKIHFYDQDLINLYNQTCHYLKDFWKSGTAKNEFAPQYFNYPQSNKINQFEAIFATFFLVYNSNTKQYPAHAVLDNFYAKQEEDGAIRGEYSEADGKPVINKKNPEGLLPPLFSWAEFNLYHKYGLKKRVKEIMPKLEKYYNWLEQKFKRPNGLYSVPLAATSMENSPRLDVEYPVDFNSQQAINALYMSYLSDIINDKEKSYRYKRYYFSLKTRINSLMWNNTDGYYYDLDKKEKQIKIKTIASFWPLLAELLNEEKGERLIQHLTNPKEFGLDNPFPTLSARDKNFDKAGCGYRGSIFPPFNYMIIKGLEKYQRYDLAYDFTLRHLYAIMDSAATSEDGKSELLWEAYAPGQPGPARWPKHDGFPRSRFLPFAAVSTIALVIENLIGLSISLPRKTVDWNVSTIELMGIEDLSLKRNFITIVTNKTARGWEIKLESEKLYYFTVHILGKKKKTLPIPSGKCSLLIEKI